MKTFLILAAAGYLIAVGILLSNDNSLESCQETHSLETCLATLN